MQLGKLRDLLAWLSHAVTLVYIMDRVLKMVTVIDFFRRPALPLSADTWPSIALLQPITRGAPELGRVLGCRSKLAYPGAVHHYLICDRYDMETQSTCHAWRAANRDVSVDIVAAGGSQPGVASKIEKLQTALPFATQDVLCFVDDDVLLRTDALTQLVAYLGWPQAGAVFGLACYTNWTNAPSSLMSGFVNGSALLSCIPLTYLIDPYTITGHLFAVPRTLFESAGGLDNLAGRIDDDHELARRIRGRGYRCVQTPVIYDVDNYLATLNDYANQMRRWFIIPCWLMVPFLTGHEQVFSLVGSIGNLLPPLSALLALLAWRRTSLISFLGTVGAYLSVYVACERLYVHRATPFRRLPLAVASALIAPIQALFALLGGSVFTWRGQRVRLKPGGIIETLAAEDR